jgi:hypothetical protein
VTRAVPNQNHTTMKFTQEQLENLRSEVISEIERDIEMNDYTAIYELLEFVPIENLLGYLPDEIVSKFK